MTTLLTPSFCALFSTPSTPSMAGSSKSRLISYGKGRKLAYNFMSELVTTHFRCKRHGKSASRHKLDSLHRLIERSLLLKAGDYDRLSPRELSGILGTPLLCLSLPTKDETNRVARLERFESRLRAQEARGAGDEYEGSFRCASAAHTKRSG